MPRFNDLSHHLDPKVIIEKAELPHDSARGKFTIKSSIARSYQEYEKTIIDYTDHHMKEVFGCSLPADHLLEKAQNYLDKSSGIKQSVYMGLSGTEGGMNTILNNIAEGFKADAKKAYFEYVVNTFVLFRIHILTPTRSYLRDYPFFRLYLF